MQCFSVISLDSVKAFPELLTNLLHLLWWSYSLNWLLQLGLLVLGSESSGLVNTVPARGKIVAAELLPQKGQSCSCK